MGAAGESLRVVLNRLNEDGRLINDGELDTDVGIDQGMILGLLEWEGKLDLVVRV